MLIMPALVTSFGAHPLVLAVAIVCAMIVGGLALAVLSEPGTWLL